MPKSQVPRGVNPMTDLGSYARGANDPTKGFVPTKKGEELDTSRWQRQRALANTLRKK